MATTPSTKRKTRRRTKAQIETDRRLAALRRNLAAEIEADIGRFAGDAQSPMAGLLVMTRVKIILAFLQAFFPMFIKPPKPRRVARRTPARKRRTRSSTTATKKTVTRKRRGSAARKTEQKSSGPGYQEIPVRDIEPIPASATLKEAPARTARPVSRPARAAGATQVRVITFDQQPGAV